MDTRRSTHTLNLVSVCLSAPIRNGRGFILSCAAEQAELTSRYAKAKQEHIVAKRTAQAWPAGDRKQIPQCSGKRSPCASACARIGGSAEHVLANRCVG